MRSRRIAAAAAAGLALADASVVVLALPPILLDLDTSVSGVAAVIGAYTVALAIGLPLAGFLSPRVDSVALAVTGMAVFAVACVGSGLAPGLGVLVTMRAVQGLAAAGVLIGAFDVLRPGDTGESGSRLWIATGILGAAVGPALGGAITELLDWRAIFFVQAPLVAAAGVVLVVTRPRVPAPAWADAPVPPVQYAAAPVDSAPDAPGRAPGLSRVALGLVSAALTGVLFLLVLLLVSGWALSPLRSAAVVSVLPVAALAGTAAGARWREPGRIRAVTGCILVGAGVLSLGFLSTASVAMTIAPQLAAGFGMGLALPALAGSLLPERTTGQAAQLLAVRHLGITLALLVLAPLLNSQLQQAESDARLKGAALILDAPLTSKEKVGVAQIAAGSFATVAPRADLRDSFADGRHDIKSADRPAYDKLRRSADDMLVGTLGGSFRWAFIACGGFALLAALLLLGPGLIRGRPTGREPEPSSAAAGSGVRRPLIVGAVVTAVLGGALVAVQSGVAAANAPPTVRFGDPCKKRHLPSAAAGGLIDGFIGDQVLKKLDEYACKYGSTREELVVALVLPSASTEYDHKYGVDPQHKFHDVIELVKKLGS